MGTRREVVIICTGLLAAVHYLQLEKKFFHPLSHPTLETTGKQAARDEWRERWEDPRGYNPRKGSGRGRREVAGRSDAPEKEVESRPPASGQSEGADRVGATRGIGRGGLWIGQGV